MPNPKPITLITGASSGIGEALAGAFAAGGHELVLVARRERQLKAIADAIARRGHVQPRIMAIDLAGQGAVTRIADELREHGLEPQYVVNNAGFALMGPAAGLKSADQLGMIELNTRVLTDLSLRFVDSLMRHRGGILNVASVAGYLPGPGMAVYHATKAYVLSFSEALHRELKPAGVRVTALCPGPVESGFRARAGIPEGVFPPMLIRSAERVARDGYRGLMEGRRVVVPSSANKVLTLMPRLLPRSLVLAIMDARRRKFGA